MTEPAYLTVPDGTRLAYLHQKGRFPNVLFLTGFRSDMHGTKAEALARWCACEGRAFTRFDYRAHGASGGEFSQATIGGWLEDTLAVIDQVTTGPLVLVGSSMGGWLALLAAMNRPERVQGLLAVAPAPDFTERLYRERLDSAQRDSLARRGYCDIPSAYDDGPYRITRQLIVEARNHRVLDRPLILRCPVQLIHGQRDEAVPWRGSLELLEHLESPDVTLQLVKQGDHRLSAPADLQRLVTTLESMLESV